MGYADELDEVKHRKRPLAAPSGPASLVLTPSGPPHSGKERKREQAIVALLTAPTLAEAAARCGVGLRTLKTWRTQPAFAAECRRAKQEMLEAATTRLRRAMSGAVEVLERVANDVHAPTAARVTAASRILELGFHAHEVEDLVARLEQLERGANDDE